MGFADPRAKKVVNKMGFTDPRTKKQKLTKWGWQIREQNTEVNKMGLADPRAKHN